MMLPDRWRAFLSGASFSRILFLTANFLVFSTAVIPGPDLPEIVSSLNDKLLHGLEYFLLFGVTVHALKTLPQDFLIAKFRGFAAIGWSLSVGILTEILQTQTVGRSGDPADAAADASGILAGYVVWKMIEQRRKMNQEEESSSGNF